MRKFCGLLVLLFCIAVMQPRADAYYGHRNYRGGRGYNPYGNRMAAIQRANAAMNAAQARAYAARNKLNVLLRQARQKVEHLPAVTSAKADHTGAMHDYQAARSRVVANLKGINSEFGTLLQQCQALRSKIAAASKSGDSTINVADLESELRTKARRVSQIENEAINADSTIKQIVAQQASAHSSEVSARTNALAAISKDPAIQAAMKQVAQAEQQAQLVASRYSGTLASANSIPYRRHRSYHRGRVGYVAYVGLGFQPRYQSVHHVRSFRGPITHAHAGFRRRR